MSICQAPDMRERERRIDQRPVITDQPRMRNPCVVDTGQASHVPICPILPRDPSAVRAALMLLASILLGQLQGSGPVD